MNSKLVVGGVVLALVFAGLAYFGDGAPGQNGRDGRDAVGAFPGPDIDSPYVSINGVARHYKNMAIRKATTTVCAIKSPAATSTLVSGAVRFSTASSTAATTITLAKSATQYATTTLIRTEAIAAAAQETIPVASTTIESSGTAAVTVLNQTNMVFAPNQWFVVGMAGGTGPSTPVGKCQVTFEAI